MDGDGRTGEHERATAETRAAFIAALERGDAGAASAVYAEDAKLLAPAAGPVEGRDAIEAFWRAGIESGIRQVEMQALDLACHGCMAHEIGSYTLLLEPDDGAAVVDRGTYLLIHERQHDGSWQRAIEVFSPTAPQAPRRGRE